MVTYEQAMTYKIGDYLKYTREDSTEIFTAKIIEVDNQDSNMTILVDDPEYGDYWIYNKNIICSIPADNVLAPKKSKTSESEYIKGAKDLLDHFETDLDGKSLQESFSNFLKEKCTDEFAEYQRLKTLFEGE